MSSAPEIPFLERWEARTHRSARGEFMPYRLLHPATASPARRYPLVLYLHGGGECGFDNVSQLTNGVSDWLANEEAAARCPCFAVAPQCAACPSGPHEPEGSDAAWSEWWNPQREGLTRAAELALEVVAAVRSELPIDADRLYIGGLSLGGYGTWDIIEERPDRFTAAFPICAGGRPTHANRLTHLPVWAFQGALDQAVPPEQPRQMIDALAELGGHPRYTEYADQGHNIWWTVWKEPELLPWLFAQRRGRGDG